MKHRYGPICGGGGSVPERTAGTVGKRSSFGTVCGMVVKNGGRKGGRIARVLGTTGENCGINLRRGAMERVGGITGAANGTTVWLFGIAG